MTSDGKAPVQKLFDMQSTPSLPLFPGQLSQGLVVAVGQIKLFIIY